MLWLDNPDSGERLPVTVAQKQWKIDGRLVGLSKLAQALQAYWKGIAKNFPGVSAIEVVIVDLTVRDSKASDGQ